MPSKNGRRRSWEPAEAVEESRRDEALRGDSEEPVAACPRSYGTRKTGLRGRGSRCIPSTYRLDRPPVPGVTEVGEAGLAGGLPGLGSSMIRGPYAGRQLGQALDLPAMCTSGPLVLLDGVSDRRGG
jgi:hypothetical protein